HPPVDESRGRRRGRAGRVMQADIARMKKSGLRPAFLLAVRISVRGTGVGAPRLPLLKPSPFAGEGWVGACEVGVARMYEVYRGSDARMVTASGLPRVTATAGRMKTDLFATSHEGLD